MPSFTSHSLIPALQRALADSGFISTTPVQAMALPHLLQGRDVLAQAQTGSGKTLAFALALLNKLDAKQTALQALVLCPTRELAEQVSGEIRKLARFIPNVKVSTLTGGVPRRAHVNSLTHAPHIVVGTPGRVLDLLKRETLNTTALQTLVLDEADRMLDMGFAEPIAEIIDLLPAQRQTLMFSATMPDSIRHLSRHYQHQVMDISVAPEGEGLPTQLTQQFYRVAPDDKFAVLQTLLLRNATDRVLVFCNTRDMARTLQTQLHEAGFAALALHGEQDQAEREATLVRFANHSCHVLIASDVAARGLDIKELPLVINYDIATDADVHTHRIGRTGRAGATGIAINLCTSRDGERVQQIAERFGLRIDWQTPSAAHAVQQRTLPVPAFRTLMIAAGKKDKLRAGDLLGALTGTAGLPATSVGKIDVFPTRSYLAIKRSDYAHALQALREGKIKGRSYRVRGLR